MYLISYKLGQSSIILRVKILNSSVATGAGLTGLTSASSGLKVSTIADNESVAVAYTVAGSTIETITTLGTYAAPTATKCRFKEVSSSNHPGVYEIQIADARFAVASSKSLLVSISGATNAAETDVVIPLTSMDPYDGVRAALTALPNAAAGTADGLLINGTNTGAITLGDLTVSDVVFSSLTVTLAVSFQGGLYLSQTVDGEPAFSVVGMSNAPAVDITGYSLSDGQPAVRITGGAGVSGDAANAVELLGGTTDDPQNSADGVGLYVLGGPTAHGVYLSAGQSTFSAGNGIIVIGGRTAFNATANAAAVNILPNTGFGAIYANAPVVLGNTTLGTASIGTVKTGNVTLGTVTTGSASLSALTVSGAVALNSTLTITGATSFGSTFAIKGAVALQSTLNVGNTTLGTVTADSVTLVNLAVTKAITTLNMTVSNDFNITNLNATIATYSSFNVATLTMANLVVSQNVLVTGHISVTNAAGDAAAIIIDGNGGNGIDIRNSSVCLQMTYDDIGFSVDPANLHTSGIGGQISGGGDGFGFQIAGGPDGVGSMGFSGGGHGLVIYGGTNGGIGVYMKTFYGHAFWADADGPEMTGIYGSAAKSYAIWAHSYLDAAVAFQTEQVGGAAVELEGTFAIDAGVGKVVLGNTTFGTVSSSSVTVTGKVTATSGITANITGNLIGAVGSVSASGIDSPAFTANAVTRLQSGLATTAGLGSVTIGGVAAGATGFRITKNTALNAFEFPMRTVSGALATGKTVTATRSIDGGAFASCANAASEVGSGIYKINLAAADLNGNVVTLKFTATGCDPTLVTIITEAA